jgi:hypothetical protein
MSRMAMCRGCGAPLISTFTFSGYEFYCLECGKRETFFGPKGATPTPELDARYEALKAEWDEHAGAKLLPVGARLADCEQCRDGEGYDHRQHATEDELAAHVAAIEWLHERAA